VEVIDSLTVSFGLTFLASAAARAASGGAGLEDIRSIVERMIPRVRIFVVLDTLEYLRRGGRIGRARAFMGNVLRVKPMLSIHDGEVHPEERVRTKKLALERLLQTVTSLRATELAIGYTTTPLEAEELRRRLMPELPGQKISIVRLGPVLGVHGGPGTVGVGVLEGEE